MRVREVFIIMSIGKCIESEEEGEEEKRKRERGRER
jgi:hypothetical protein